MQAGGRRCGGPVLFRVHRLVAVPVLQFFMDIRRQGHLPQPVQDLLENAVIEEADGAAASFLHVSKDFTGEEPIAEGAAGSRLQPAAGADQRFPIRGVDPAQEQHLHGHAGILLNAEQARGNYLRLINDEGVPGIQVINDIVEMFMFNGTVLPVVHEQAAVVPGFHGGLGDQLFREFIIEIGGFHGSVRSPS